MESNSYGKIKSFSVPKVMSAVGHDPDIFFPPNTRSPYPFVWD
jgi:hypothetical protein